MPSQLVTDIRGLIRTRGEAGQPLTGCERALLLATLAPPRRGGGDAIAELDDAITHARRTLLSDPEPDVVLRRAATRRLLAAARGILDYAPDADYDPADAAPAVAHGGRPMRADIDL